MPPITGKQRASRIPLDYYKHPDRLVRWKRWLTWGAGILTVLWVASLIPAGERSLLGPSRFSHGGLATAHKPIESDCAACHRNFAFVASRDDAGHFKGDKLCQQCHLEGDLAWHHEAHGQKVAMTPNCGRCHSDHHGLNFPLTRTLDRDCVV